MVTLEQLLEAAKELEASDIHLTVGLPPCVRVNGELRTLSFPKLLPQDVKQFVYRILNDTEKKIFEEKGEADFSFSIPKVGRYRVNAFHQRGSVACSMRVVGTTIPDMEELGLPKSVRELYSKKRGLVIVTGPTGSGKSTTLASLINKINVERNCHIITLEDPIEFLHSHNNSMVNQREIGLDTLSYSAALRAALREDPDVILVGEMRDLETIATAITAAETGHLVLSTLHTIGAAATIDRIIDVFPPHQQQQIRIQLSMVLEAVISQQLIARSDHPGRVAAFEVLLATVPVRNLIRESKTYQINSYMQTNKKLGMNTMDEQLVDLCMKGIISSENAINYAQDPLYVDKRIGNYYTE